MKDKHLVTLIRTAIFLSLLISFQLLTISLGQYFTGTLVNMTLVACLLLNGFYSAFMLAPLSSIMAFILGIGPAIPQLIPIIILANITLILIWHFTLKLFKRFPEYLKHPIAIVLGASGKFLVCYIGVVKIAVPALKLPVKQADKISLMFSYPQLLTALAGGVIAALVANRLKPLSFFK